MKNPHKKPGGWRRCLMTFALLGFLAQGIHAAVPTLINFQGKLLDTNNNPRNGTFSMTFRICDTPASSCASPIWTETQGSVAVSNGVFSVQLGASTALASSVFSSDARYLEIQIGSEVAGTRQRLVTSPYAHRAAVADDVSSGDGDYVQNRDTLQAGTTFYVSSGTVSGPLTVGGVLVAGSGANQVTTAAGLLDATKLSGTVPSGNISGTYSNALTLSNASNVLSGNGAGLTNVLAADLVPGNTNYIQNRNTLQSGATFYVSSATVQGNLTATNATVTNALTVGGNLTVNGAGPHAFTGDLRVNGNDLQDSGGTSRITLGANTTINGNLGAPVNQAGVQISSSVLFVGTVNGDNFIAYPFTAGSAITDRSAVVISGNNTVDDTATANHSGALGIAVNSVANAGDTVYVALSGIVTNVVANGAIAVGGTAHICTAAVTGRVQTCTNANNALFAKPLTGTSAAGETLTVVIWTGR